jgi:hypothetical protein
VSFEDFVAAATGGQVQPYAYQTSLALPSAERARRADITAQPAENTETTTPAKAIASLKCIPGHVTSRSYRPVVEPRRRPGISAGFRRRLMGAHDAPPSVMARDCAITARVTTGRICLGLSGRRPIIALLRLTGVLWRARQMLLQ